MKLFFYPPHVRFFPNMKYPTPGDSTMSFCWLRVFAFASNFVPNQARPGDVFGLMVGDAVEGNLAATDKYGTTVLEA